MHTKKDHENKDEETINSIPGDSHSSRRSTRRRCICLSVTLPLITIGLLILILSQTVFKSKKPVTTVNSIILKDINADINLIPLTVSLNISININISIKNRNKVGITYKNSSAVLRYKSHDIGHVPIPAGKIGSEDTKHMNLTLTIFADRLLSDVNVYGNVISGNFPVSTYTRISGKIRVLNLFNIRVVTTSTCDLNIDILNRRIVSQKCR